MLSCEKLRELLDYDPATGIFIWKPRPVRAEYLRTDRTWNGRFAGSQAGTLVNGYVCILIHRKSYRAHRLAWLYVHGVWPVSELDHEKGNRADNRIEKLREATRGQNMQNRKPNKNNTSGYVGVVRKGQRWTAQIKLDGKHISLGNFDDPKDAHEAYLAGKARLHTFQPVPRAA